MDEHRRFRRAFLLTALAVLIAAGHAHRAGATVAILIAGDDRAAVATVAQLVQDAGFDPVIVGKLSRAREFDAGTPVYGELLTAPQLRQALKPPNR